MNKQTKPYHETVISLIATTSSAEDAARIAAFIRCTTLPANHDTIIAAWRQLLCRLKLTENDPTGVITSVMAQKAAEQGEELLLCVAGC